MTRLKKPGIHYWQDKLKCKHFIVCLRPDTFKYIKVWTILSSRYVWIGPSTLNWSMVHSSVTYNCALSHHAGHCSRLQTVSVSLIPKNSWTLGLWLLTLQWPSQTQRPNNLIQPCRSSALRQECCRRPGWKSYWTDWSNLVHTAWVISSRQQSGCPCMFWLC